MRGYTMKPEKNLLKDIPAFLIRKKKRGRPRKIVAIENSEQDIHSQQQQWNAIKRNRYGVCYKMHLAGELPRFGCGYRIFYVKEGRKWARFTAHIGDPENTERRMRGRLSLTKWAGMKREHEQCTKRNTPNEVAKRISRRRSRTI